MSFSVILSAQPIMSNFLCDFKHSSCDFSVERSAGLIFNVKEYFLRGISLPWQSPATAIRSVLLSSNELSSLTNSFEFSFLFLLNWNCFWVTILLIISKTHSSGPQITDRATIFLSCYFAVLDSVLVFVHYNLRKALRKLKNILKSLLQLSLDHKSCNDIFVLLFYCACFDARFYTLQPYKGFQKTKENIKMFIMAFRAL